MVGIKRKNNLPNTKPTIPCLPVIETKKSNDIPRSFQYRV